MHFSKLVITTAFVSAMLALSGCAKKEQESKTADQSITATAPVTGEASTLSERNTQQRLTHTLQENLDKAGLKVKVLSISNTEIPNMYRAALDGFPAVLTTADGKYIFQGEIIRLDDKKVHNVSEGLQAVENKEIFAKLNPKDLIVYPATGKTKHTVYVFTDVGCPYCQKFHHHMNDFNKLGIEVRYIAWPRGDQFFPAMQSIWCSEDRRAAFDTASNSLPVHAEQCDSPVKAQYELGTKIGVNGTPAVYSSEGYYLGGYFQPNDLLKRLNEK